MCQKSNLEMQEYSSWVDYSEFLSTLPTSRGRKYEELLKLGQLQEMRDDDGRYYFVITEIRRTGDAAPLERVRETIRRILFNQRQSEIIRAHEERIYTEALASGELRINLGDEEVVEEMTPTETATPTAAPTANPTAAPTEKSEPTEKSVPTVEVDTTNVAVADTTKQETKK